MITITDKAVRRAARALYLSRSHGDPCCAMCVDHFVHDTTDARSAALADARVALEAALPHLEES
ncbi:hypothetical protein [Kribbella sp. NPDC050470]|uniref:hypothetical protein n=1 Tax=unclassified Kribbella TaxID=2644121 RepID=UPI00379699AD